MYFSSIVLLASAFTRWDDLTERFWREPNQCAAWACFHSCKLRRIGASESDIAAVLPIDGRPKSMLELRNALRTLGIDCFARSMTIEQSARNPDLPVIACLRHSPTGDLHFALLVGWNDGRAFFADGPAGSIDLSIEELRPAWVDTVIVLDCESMATVNFWALAITVFVVSFAVVTVSGRCRRQKRGAVVAFYIVMVASSISCLGCSGDAAARGARRSLAFTKPAMIVTPSARVTVAGTQKGSLFTGETVFTIKNPVNRRITVKRILTDCGCLAADLASEFVDAQSEVKLRATISGSEYSGARGKAVIVWHDDEFENTVIEVTLAARFQPPILMMPRSIDLGEVSPNKRTEFRILTCERVGSIDWLKSCSSDSEDTEFVLVGASKAASVRGDVEYRYFTVRMQTHCETGAFLRRVNFLDSEGRIVASMECRFVVPPLYRASPSELLFVCRGNDPTPLRRELLLQLNVPLQQIAALPRVCSSLPAWVSVEASDCKSTSESQGLCHVVVSVDPTKLQSSDESISVKLAFNTDEVISIPLRVINHD